jgi:hypothetical protein
MYTYDQLIKIYPEIEEHLKNKDDRYYSVSEDIFFDAKNKTAKHTIYVSISSPSKGCDIEVKIHE